MSFIPLPERGGIDLNYGTFDQSIRPDQFVIGRIVHLCPRVSFSTPFIAISTYDTDDSRLSSDVLAAPGEIAGIEP